MNVILIILGIPLIGLLLLELLARFGIDFIKELVKIRKNRSK